MLKVRYYYVMMSMKDLYISGLIVLTISVCIHGQCEIKGINSHGGNSDIGVSWNCDQSHNEFMVTYQIIEACGIPVADSFDMEETGWLKNTHFTVYKDYAKIYANSTYQFTVKSRTLKGGGYVFSTPETVNYKTGPDIYLSANLHVDKDYYSHPGASFWAHWTPYPDQCVRYNGPVVYDYQLIRDDGHIAHSGVINGERVMISDVECQTSYQFKVAYRTDNGSGPVAWWSGGPTDLYKPPSPVISLSAKNTTSLLFNWTKYLPCNTRNEIEASYSYDLSDTSLYRAWDKNRIGSTNATFVSFSNLKPNHEYAMKVRVNIKSPLGFESDSYDCIYVKTGSTGQTIYHTTRATTDVLSVIGMIVLLSIVILVIIIFVVLLTKAFNKTTASQGISTKEESKKAGYEVL